MDPLTLAASLMQLHLQNKLHRVLAVYELGHVRFPHAQSILQEHHVYWPLVYWVQAWMYQHDYASGDLLLRLDWWELEVRRYPLGTHAVQRLPLVLA